ncbi:hypothetical protein HK104_000250 [Borealophlyctis nickersoniae]|nr:hypothetical protein HK104_000250 [Borealophlyctis nickersoniae]
MEFIPPTLVVGENRGESKKDVLDTKESPAMGEKGEEMDDGLDLLGKDVDEDPSLWLE